MRANWLCDPGDALQNIDGLVLVTVNAPWKETLDAEQLARAVAGSRTGAHLSHLASFFGEVSLRLVLTFADQHGISRQDLSATYEAVKRLTGERNLALEAALQADGAHEGGS